MALSNSQYNAVMRGYEERQRLQRRAMEARVREVYSKIRTGGSERAETDAFKISRVPGRLYGASL